MVRTLMVQKALGVMVQKVQAVNKPQKSVVSYLKTAMTMVNLIKIQIKDWQMLQ